MADGYRPLVSTAAGAGSALLFLVPLSMGEMAVTGLPDPTIGSVAGILYLGLLASAAAYLLWNHALTQVDAAFAAPFVNLVPIIGIALALILGETITPMQLAGGGIVGLGVWLSSLKPRVRRKLTREYA
jgi:drug/metabolite transporter (DMT)-like permease